MSYYDTYSPYAIQAANQYGIPPNLFEGLIAQESSWNPFASPGTTSAYGFTQLTNAAAAQVGVDKFNPIQNIFGGAQYLASMPGSDWTTKLAHYFQGPGATINQSGLSYAQSVMDKAKGFISNAQGWANTAANGAACLAGDPLACASAAGDVLGGGSGGKSWIDELKDWIRSTGFFQRIALALVALILILGAIYTLKGKAT